MHPNRTDLELPTALTLSLAPLRFQINFSPFPPPPDLPMPLMPEPPTPRHTPVHQTVTAKHRGNCLQSIHAGAAFFFPMTLPLADTHPPPPGPTLAFFCTAAARVEASSSAAPPTPLPLASP